MVMEDRDNIMIEEFLKQAARQQIEDNGFTERVMAQLPDRRIETVRRLSRLWTVFCVVTAGILFFAFGGLQMMKAGVMSMPALMVNGKIVSAGKSLSVAEVKKLLGS